MRKTLAYSKKLEAAGLSRELAEAHLEILTDVVEDEMATKSDLKEAKSQLQTQIENTRSELRSEIQEFRSEVDQRFQNVQSQISELELRMTIKFGAMQVATIGILVTVLKLF